MIAVFLHQELASERYRDRIISLLDAIGADTRLIVHPDLLSSEENAQRRMVLRLHRGYDSEEGEYLSGFPTQNVKWRWARFTPHELMSANYISWGYWMELSGGTRLPSIAAARIRGGEEANGVSNSGFWTMAELVAQGHRLPPPILVTAGAGNPLVILEGHVRMTAFALQADSLPVELDALVGARRISLHGRSTPHNAGCCGLTAEETSPSDPSPSHGGPRLPSRSRAYPGCLRAIRSMLSSS